MHPSSSGKTRVAFVHPDLGLGGAERLVVDAAVELVRAGCSVDVYTAHYDPQRCFEETKTGGFRVVVAGSWFPRSLGGRFIALCAYIRCLIAAVHLAWCSWRPGAAYQVVFVDQVSAVIPLLHLLTRSQVLFYCHFPDLLLATRKSLLKRIYRAPLDWVEETTTGQADLLLVNSKFTLETFGRTFTRLHQRGVKPQVLYPAVPMPSEAQLAQAAKQWRDSLGADLAAWVDAGPLILSINRFERKKGLALAVKALKQLVDGGGGGQGSKGGAGAAGRARLLLAGGWDARLAENVQHLQELKQLVQELGLSERVRFLPSFTDAQRAALLAACAFVVYTPQFEHFGIVPLEAMAAGRPVVAVNNGGPLESVAHGQTGLLCDPTPAAFARAFAELLALPAGKLAGMGAAARQRVQVGFSREAFGRALHAYVRRLAAVAAANQQADGGGAGAQRR